MAAESSWSTGVLIGLPVTALIVTVLLVVAVFCIRWSQKNRSDFDATSVWWAGIAAASVAVVALLIAGWAFYPYSGEYHRWTEKTGTVADVSSRILGSDSSFEQKFVVRFTDDHEYACQDTRCSLIKPGDHLTLSCKRAWQFTGRDGWDCNYISRERPS